MRRFLSYLLWPMILLACFAVTQLGITLGYSIVGFNLTYLALGAALWWLERTLPHEEKWLHDDGQVKADLSHTILNKGAVQIIVTVSTVFGVAGKVGNSGLQFWPYAWPLALQVALALVIVEFGLYWKHRLSHESAWLWPFHAVHHSAPRLWFLNTGRFHFVDTVSGLLFGLPILFALGAPEMVFSWVAAITAYIGMLTHCNIDMRFGFLSNIFNTPELHRWHHSRVLREGNTNYGENLMLWDQLFGTFFRPDRRPPVNIGISHHMPETFWGQLKTPFMHRLADETYKFPISRKKRSMAPAEPVTPPASEQSNP